MWLNDKRNNFNKNYYRNNNKNDNNSNNDINQLIMFENQNVSTNSKSNLILINLIINKNYYNKNNYFISTIQVKRKS